MAIVRLISVLALALALSGCATLASMPESADAFDFEGVEGKTGWSEYVHRENFRGYTTSQIYEAAKVGLGGAGFSIRAADSSKGVVIGEHGMTAHDWNVLAGVYFREHGNGTLVGVLVEGSKDIGFSGDVTSDGWSGKILKGMRDYLNATFQSILKIDKSDLK